MQDIFTKIYDDNHWQNDESVSGHGSTLEATSAIRSALPVLLEHYGVTSMVDVACGDLNWVRHVKFPPKFRYVGIDIVPQLIDANTNNLDYFEDGWFELGDITRDPIPTTDLILARDVLVHFSNADVRLALNNIMTSKAKYLLVTTFPRHENSGDIKTGEWRPINLASMWGLPYPLEYINEGCTAGNGAFADKSLGLWDLQEARRDRQY